MRRRSEINSLYECPCGYSYTQTDNREFRKLKMMIRLHKKKCEMARIEEENSVDGLQIQCANFDPVRSNKDNILQMIKRSKGDLS